MQTSSASILDEFYRAKRLHYGTPLAPDADIFFIGRASFPDGHASNHILPGNSQLIHRCDCGDGSIVIVLHDLCRVVRPFRWPHAIQSIVLVTLVICTFPPPPAHYGLPARARQFT